jgi:hypothetical protein
MLGKTTPSSAASISPTNLFAIGADLLGEVQRIIGSNRVRALHIKLGSRTLKEVPMGPLTAAATVVLVIIAVLVSSIRIEVEHEPSINAVNEALP